MKNWMNYKGYIGSVEFSEEDNVFYGKAQGIHSLISYEGTNVNELASDFHSAVDEYLESCRQDGTKSEKQLLHMADHHPDAYSEALIELKATVGSPDYIFRDSKRPNTGLVAKRLPYGGDSLYIVLRICTDSHNGILANSVISGWKISAKRLENYIRNREILYKKE